MKVVVTGASGLIGRHLSVELDLHGHAVVGIDRTPAEPIAGRFAVADLTEMEQIEPALRGADAVVHLARIPFPYTADGYNQVTRTWLKPDHIGDAEKFNRNLAMTYNILAMARSSGVSKVVVGSSFAAYGLYYPSRPLLPEYLPIDEVHPRRPDDPYGLTKLLGEQLADAYASSTSVQIVSLRFPGVSRETATSAAARHGNPMVRGIGGLWTYIDARDAARACRLALQADFAGHEAFNICAPITFMNTPTDELLRRYLPDVPLVKTNTAPNWAAYDASKAERMLGFRAQHLITA